MALLRLTLPEAVCAGYDAGLLDFPSNFIGKPEPEFIEVFTASGLTLAHHGEYLIRDEHGLWSHISRDEFRATYEIITHRKKAQA